MNVRLNSSIFFRGGIFISTVLDGISKTCGNIDDATVLPWFNWFAWDEEKQELF